MIPTTIKPAEVLAAAPDAFALKLGATRSRPHPLAAELSSRDIAYAIGAQVRKPTPEETPVVVAARGWRSPVFAALVAEGVKHITVATFDDAAREHLAFTAETFVNGFQPEGVAALDGDLDLQLLSNEFQTIERGTAFTATGGTVVQLLTYAKIIGISRQTIINDDLGALKTIFAAVGAHAAQREAAIIASTLSGNPDMDDNAPMFDAANTVAAALDGTALGTALGMLRNQKSAAGNALNLRAAHLVVAPELEYAARKAVLDGGLNIKVAALAGLPAARWFVLADPAVHPVLAHLRLAGSRGPIRIEHKAPDSYDGTAVRVTADVGAAFLRRTGIVKGGV